MCDISFSFIEHKGKNMYILGISALYHDAAAAVIEDGEIIAAAQEERFTRIKHDSSFQNMQFGIA